MPQSYTPEFKKKIVCLHIEDGRTYKSITILRKGNRLEAYRFIEQYHKEFGVRWLLRRLAIMPNAYYNYRKHRKAA